MQPSAIFMIFLRIFVSLLSLPRCVRVLKVLLGYCFLSRLMSVIDRNAWVDVGEKSVSAKGFDSEKIPFENGYTNTHVRWERCELYVSWYAHKLRMDTGWRVYCFVGAFELLEWGRCTHILYAVSHTTWHIYKRNGTISIISIHTGASPQWIMNLSYCRNKESGPFACNFFLFSRIMIGMAKNCEILALQA